jgi:putative DNA primase/helicase
MIGRIAGLQDSTRGAATAFLSRTGAAVLEKPHYLDDDEWNAAAIIADCKKIINLREAVGGDSNQGEIDRLASLDPIAYDGEREAAAERLSCRVSTLDKLVSAKRSERAESEAVELCADTEPCAEPVNVVELLDTVRAVIRRFIVCEPETATAATLWIAFTWIIGDVHVAPLAIITAPEKGCGKTQLLVVIGRLSRRALFASNISPAATFRVIEAKSPTLLIDEADAFFRENEELRGVINSGHTRTSAYVIRTVGDCPGSAALRQILD